MIHSDDPMRSQHLLLGAEAFPDCHPLSNSHFQSTPPRNELNKAVHHRGNQPAVRPSGSSLLSLALMFCGRD